MQKELTVTQSAEHYQRICFVLNEHQIRYFTKIADRRNPHLAFFSFLGTSSRRSALGELGEKAQSFYYIFVRRRDLEKARHLLGIA